MNAEQNYAVSRAENTVREIRRKVEELSSFGWKANEPTRPLQAFAAFRLKLEGNQTARENVSPLDRDYKQKMTALLSEENLLIEGLSKSAEEAATALVDEEISFFQSRDGYFEQLQAELEQADNQIKNGLSWMLDGLQSRWKLMIKKQELAQRFQDISQKHNTEESFHVGQVALPKPFPKLGSPIWGAFVASFLQRLGATLPSFEQTEPADAIRTIFEK